MNISSDIGVLSALMIVFFTGLIGGLSPCTLPTVAFTVAYVSGKQSTSRMKAFILSLSFVLGIAFMLTILGLFAGILGNVFLKSNIIHYLMSVILIVMGLWMLKVIDFSRNKSGPYFNTLVPKKGSGIIGAFILGIPFGISASPCTMPITASVLAYSASTQSGFIGMLMMFTYAIGRSIPLLLVGTFTGILNNLKVISKYQSHIEKISGILLIILALYFIWKA
ncbi:MAG: hypothetical protein CVV02_04630 [Firmicutes bacterium HGW-Firmicutes-7]|nr:MAG: hypothetical protein CVV02_04630 [Firmicutes bacterium HGW-Firmicutes-7]